MDLVIIAAGNGTRMGDVIVPKTLFPIKGKPNLWYTLEAGTLEPRIDQIYVVIKKGTYSFYQETVSKFPHVCFVEIESGLGDGHAIMTALGSMPLEGKAIIVWGDAHIENGGLFAELCNKDKCHAPVLVPVILENNPYVSFIVDEETMAIKRADFGKFNEVTTFRGFHDQSVFLIDKPKVSAALRSMHNVLYKGNAYASKSGDLNFLYLMHMLWNNFTPCVAYETTHAVGSFNTRKEALELS